LKCFLQFLFKNLKNMKVLFAFNHNCMIDLLIQWNPDNWNIMNIYPRSDGFEWDSHGKVNFFNKSNFKQSFNSNLSKIRKIMSQFIVFVHLFHNICFDLGDYWLWILYGKIDGSRCGFTKNPSCSSSNFELKFWRTSLERIDLQ
jgi:hypothetical protein